MSEAVPKTTRMKAYGKVHSAIKRGDLKKPAGCECCGDPERKGRDGRSLLQAHHHNGYDEALDVQWLCTGCHAPDTPRPCGTDNPASKFSEASVSLMRNKEVPALVAAETTGASLGYVYQVRRAEWRALKTPTGEDT